MADAEPIELPYPTYLGPIVMRCRNVAIRRNTALRAWNDATITPSAPMPRLQRCLLATSALFLLLAGCATPMPRKDDPYENFNRKMYAFNDFADRNAIRPVAVGYRKITNETSRRLISNFFANAEAPITIANDVLQLN